LALLGCDRITELTQTTVTSTPSTVTLSATDCSSSGEAAPAHACLSGELSCGSVVTGTTMGGDSAWDDGFYSQAFCFPSGDRHSGSERVYSLALPKNTEATVTLQSDCVDLDLVVLAWHYEGSCPNIGHPIAECEGDNKRGGGQVKLQSFNTRDYLVGIDGKGGAVGPYTLRVDCRDLRPPEEVRKPPGKR
jgi:hypothetical protein